MSGMREQVTRMFGGEFHRLYGEIDLRDLAKKVRRDGSHDCLLSEEDLMGLIDGADPGDWGKVFFTFDELLAYYLAHGNPGLADYPAVCLSLVATAVASSKGGGDFSFTFDKMLRVMHRFENIVDYEMRASHLYVVLSSICEPEHGI